VIGRFFILEEKEVKGVSLLPSFSDIPSFPFFRRPSVSCGSFNSFESPSSCVSLYLS